MSESLDKLDQFARLVLAYRPKKKRKKAGSKKLSPKGMTGKR